MSNKTPLPRFTKGELPEAMTLSEVEANRFTLDALEAHKREGLELAIRARWVATGIIAVMLPFLNPRLEVLYVYPYLILFALIGWAQRQIGQVGRSGWELVLLFCDLALLTFLFTVPPFFSEVSEWPTPMTYHFGNFAYFYVVLAAGTLSYNWRTITAIGNWTAGMWVFGILCVWMFGRYDPALTEGMAELFGDKARMLEQIDPNAIKPEMRAQEIVVFLIVTYTLALTVRRFTRLILGNAALARERENLSRYFSPNVVEELSQNDEPLRMVREQEVTVLFADLVGFTTYASTRPAREVIETLRQFHGRMEACVFGHAGTLDKYLGDGLMATFGTPLTGPDDAARALACAQNMLRDVADLNAQRTAEGLEPLQVSVGIHSGPVVLGDIGANRLEFAVIGNTVNVASRMEGLTRKLDAALVLSTEAKTAAAAQGADTSMLKAIPDQTIRGVEGTVTVFGC